MRKNILYLDVNSNLGGAERRLLTEVRCIDKDIFSITVGLLSEGPLSEELRKFGIPYVVFPCNKGFLRLSKERLRFASLFSFPLAFFSSVLLAFRISTFIINNNVDLIITYSFKMHLISFLLHLTGKDIIWQYCDLLPENKILRKTVLLLSRMIPVGIITNSRYVKGQFLQHGISREVETVHDGFILSEFQYNEGERERYRNEFGMNPDSFCVGCIGVLVEWKGQENLIKAARVLKDKIPNLKVFIIGGMIYDTDTVDTKEKLLTLVKELNLEDIITFTGFIKENKKIICALDIIVHAPVRPEPFGRVIVEGMLCGRPVIATAAGGPLEIIQDNVTGKLVPPKNPEKIAEVIMDLYSNANKRKLLGEQGRRYAQEHFDALKQTAAIEDFYLEIIN